MLCRSSEINSGTGPHHHHHPSLPNLLCLRHTPSLLLGPPSLLTATPPGPITFDSSICARRSLDCCGTCSEALCGRLLTALFLQLLMILRTYPHIFASAELIISEQAFTMLELSLSISFPARSLASSEAMQRALSAWSRGQSWRLHGPHEASRLFQAKRGLGRCSGRTLCHDEEKRI